MEIVFDFIVLSHILDVKMHKNMQEKVAKKDNLMKIRMLVFLTIAVL